MPEILLSVLIPSIPRRLPKLTHLLRRLEAQADPQMEVICLLDNCSRHLGEKRNEMMRMARGMYLAHIDDDEDLATDFFAVLKPELAHGVDLVHYNAAVSLNGSPFFRVSTVVGAACEQPKHLPGGCYSDIVRPPWHWNAWRSDFARRFKFPEHYDAAEDAFWLRQVWPEIRTHRKVERTLFFHNYSATDSTFDGSKPKI